MYAGNIVVKIGALQRFFNVYMNLPSAWKHGFYHVLYLQNQSVLIESDSYELFRWWFDPLLHFITFLNTFWIKNHSLMAVNIWVLILHDLLVYLLSLLRIVHGVILFKYSALYNKILWTSLMTWFLVSGNRGLKGGWQKN